MNPCFPTRRIYRANREVAAPARCWWLLLAATLLAAGCHEKPVTAGAAETADPTVTKGRIAFPANSPQLSSVVVETAQPGLTRALHFPGRLVWNDNLTVRVFSPFAGRVTRIVRTPGDAVTKGTPLAYLASPDFGQAQADARKAATDAGLAERTLTRIRELHAAGAAPQKDLQSAEADLARTQSEAQRAQARLALFGASADTIDSSFPLLAPIDGVVVERNLNLGQEVRPDQMLANIERLAAPPFIITDPTKLWLLLDVTEAEINHLKVGQKVTLRSLGDPDHPANGTIQFINDSLDPATRAFKVRVDVENAARTLKAEMLVDAEISVNVANAFKVQERAVFFKGDRHYVFTEISPSTFTRREVTIGARDQGQIQIINGLHDGERVVTDGSMLLEQIRQGSEGG